MLAFSQNDKLQIRSSSERSLCTVIVNFECVKGAFKNQSSRSKKAKAGRRKNFTQLSRLEKGRKKKRSCNAHDFTGNNRQEFFINKSTSLFSPPRLEEKKG